VASPRLYFSRDGRQLASCSTSGLVRIWDDETGALRQTRQGHIQQASCVAFSYDGRWLASVSSNEMTVKIWDSEKGTLEQSLKSHTDGVKSILCSRDGQLVSGQYGYRMLEEAQYRPSKPIQILFTQSHCHMMNAGLHQLPRIRHYGSGISRPVRISNFLMAILKGCFQSYSHPTGNC
jgi:WD40 repeat protein